MPANDVCAECGKQTDEKNFCERCQRVFCSQDIKKHFDQKCWKCPTVACAGNMTPVVFSDKPVCTPCYLNITKGLITIMEQHALTDEEKAAVANASNKLEALRKKHMSK
jgi:hypothetical protein